MHHHCKEQAIEERSHITALLFPQHFLMTFSSFQSFSISSGSSIAMPLSPLILLSYTEILSNLLMAFSTQHDTSQQGKMLPLLQLLSAALHLIASWAVGSFVNHANSIIVSTVSQLQVDKAKILWRRCT